MMSLLLASMYRLLPLKLVEWTFVYDQVDAYQLEESEMKVFQT